MKRPKSEPKQRGSIIVEFSLVIPLLLLIVFGIADLGVYYYTQTTLQYALREAARYTAIGTGFDLVNDPSQNRRIEAIKNVVIQEASGINIQKENIVVTNSFTALCDHNIPGTGCNNLRANIEAHSILDSLGGAKEPVAIYVLYTHNFITPMIAKFINNGQKVFIMRTTFYTEPFVKGAVALPPVPMPPTAP